MIAGQGDNSGCAWFRAALERRNHHLTWRRSAVKIKGGEKMAEVPGLGNWVKSSTSSLHYEDQYVGELHLVKIYKDIIYYFH